MKLPKSLIIAGVTATVGLAGLTGLGVASAHNGLGGNDLAAKIADKFNLNQDEVQAVFDEQHAAIQKERQAENSQRLQQLVDDGKITAEQKTLIEEKQAEQQTERQSEREALQTWATDNNIDLRYVMPGGRRGGDSDRLQQAVDNGDITADQKALIEQKQSELQAEREAHRTEMQQWATDNGIDLQYLRPTEAGHRGPRGGGAGPGRLM